MLKNLEILNGNMTLKFDPLNTIYTINVNSDIFSLNMNYTLLNNCELSIAGNDNFNEGLNKVVLTVYNNEDKINYYLYVYKDATTEANVMDNYGVPLEIEESVSSYAVPGISAICFLIILLVFTMLFKKRT